MSRGCPSASRLFVLHISQLPERCQHRWEEKPSPSAEPTRVWIAHDDGTYTVDPDGAAGPAAPFSFGNPDFNYKSMRGTVVFRWEYRPGSLIYFVWTQNRADYANPGNLRLWRDLGDLFSAPGDNIFLLKISYPWNM